MTVVSPANFWLQRGMAGALCALMVLFVSSSGAIFSGKPEHLWPAPRVPEESI